MNPSSVFRAWTPAFSNLRLKVGRNGLFTAFGGYVFIGSIVNARIVDRQSHSQLFFANQRRHEAKSNEKSSLAGRDQPLYATDQKKRAGSFKRFVFETFIGS